MTEVQDPNPFEQFFTNTEMVGPILASEADDGSVFGDAIETQFQQVMGELAEQVPDDDEDAANTLMAQAVQNLMFNSFRAGMLYESTINGEDRPDTEESIALVLDPSEASALVTGLVGNGALLRVVVDRGSN